MSLSDVASWEIFLWALYQLGGSAQFVDIEDISVKCFEIAPARFKWRTRDLPDYKKCTKALQVAEKMEPRLLIKTGDSFGRQLTVEGQKWIESNSKRLSRLLESGSPVPEPKQRPSARLLAEIERSEPFIQWNQLGIVPPEKWKVAEVLRCSPDSSPSIWSDRLATARAIANSAQKNDVLHFLDQVAVEHPDWFGG